ncbi:nucleotidyltransferase family protein [Pedobacter aquatilis]|uniref:nucleotidyltransferase family protein n=1 Tax=Pedobacter aquatilis TaxID=351343 RepID=UPI0025B4F542|nr:nucleotidyltransferase family protein [Pedobacter aquatilis]MDN3586221.1 nucleotidyltransferase family protein [Pedobacter aquatilis]
MTNMVSNKQALFSTLLVNRKMIKSFGVSKLGVFGSFITGNLKTNSDVDFLVEFLPEEKSYDNYLNLSYYLEGLLGRKVELVTPQSLSKHIGPYILNQTEYVAI